MIKSETFFAIALVTATALGGFAAAGAGAVLADWQVEQIIAGVR